MYTPLVNRSGLLGSARHIESLFGVILLWQQVRFLDQRVEKFKQETNVRLDRIIDILLANALQASKASAADTPPLHSANNHHHCRLLAQPLAVGLRWGALS